MNANERGIFEAAQLLRQGTLRPLDLVEVCLAAIECREEHVHAWVHVDADGARQAAEQLGREADQGRWRTALHGIPIGVKDIIDVRAMPTRAGSPLRANHVAGSDAEIVSRLRRAGAILLGKTVTTQFACFDPAETVNPCDASRTPGGSSSGSAAAVACFMCFAALGTQTGGSITRPAAYCGVAGLKPTLGAWSTRGVIPVSFHLDHVGPIARSVSDLLAVWHAVQSLEQHDIDPPDLTPLATPRLGMPNALFQQLLEPGMSSIIDSAIARLVVAGAEIESVVPPNDFTDVLAMHRCVMAVEAAEYHREAFARHPDAYAPNLAGLIDQGLETAAVDYAAALKHRRAFITEMQQQLGPDTIWLTPATPAPPPPRATTGDPALNVPWSYCGFPTLSLPCGRADDGLPVALQLIGRPGSEERLLRAGLWCQHAL